MKAGDKLGRYEITSLLARGGMAEVWLATARGAGGFNKEVVVKTILPYLAQDPDFVYMFINEALLAARLNHPNIVQIFDLGHVEQAYFIAMEYVPGKTLRQISRGCRERKELLPPWFTLRVMASVAEALHYAHHLADENGKPLKLIHRDVTPENIMVSYSGTVKILDFGVAKATAIASGTRAGIIKGKYAYLSPEQARGIPADHRSDIYAVGVCLYELLTGQRPFWGDNDMAILKRVSQGNPEPPSAIAPWMPERLEQLILKALAYEPDDRFPDAGALEESITSFLESAHDMHAQREMGLFVSSLFPDEPAIPSNVQQRLTHAPSVAPVIRRLPTDSKPTPPMPTDAAVLARYMVSAPIPPAEFPEFVISSASDEVALSSDTVSEGGAKTVSVPTPPPRQEAPLQPPSARAGLAALGLVAVPGKPAEAAPPEPAREAQVPDAPLAAVKTVEQTSEHETEERPAEASAAATLAPAPARKKATSFELARPKTAGAAVAPPTPSMPTPSMPAPVSPAPSMPAPATLAPPMPAPLTVAPAPVAPSPVAPRSEPHAAPPPVAPSGGAFEVEGRTPERTDKMAALWASAERLHAGGAEDKLAALWDSAGRRPSEAEAAAAEATALEVARSAVRGAIREASAPEPEEPRRSELDLPSPAGIPTHPGLPEEPRRDIFQARRHSLAQGDDDVFTSYRRVKERPSAGAFATRARSATATAPAAAPRAKEPDGWKRVEQTPEQIAARHFDEGLALLRKGDRPAALAEWERAVELAPDNRVYQSNLKRLRQHLGKDEDPGSPARSWWSDE
jgi:serine/threonine protein kinase